MKNMADNNLHAQDPGWGQLLSLVEAGLKVRTDSRLVNPGEVFVALPGVNHDGAQYIPQALARGAAYLVAAKRQDLPPGCQAKLLARPDIRQALGQLASAQHHTRALNFPLLGVTGTNGKTTVTYLLEHILTRAGLNPGVIGTVEYRWPGHAQPASHTTPDCMRLHELLGQMAQAGVKSVVMEASSHALDQDRLAGISFEAAALTNITQDHLDYHQDMDSYFQAKRVLFTKYLKDPTKAVINFDDVYGRMLLQEFPLALGYGLGHLGAPKRALTARVVKSGGRGLELEMAGPWGAWSVQSPLIGAFNASNLLAAQGLALNLGLEASSLECLADCHGAPGRLERVQNPQGLSVFVDYAHTPDALENVLGVLRSLDFQKVVAVFGCGGDRDRAKRPLMAQAVAKWADVAVLTSDNPRHENPMDIINDAAPGLAKAAKVIIHEDRRTAIELALAEVDSRDVLLIAGKGHETYQQIGDVKHPFNDVSVAKEILSCA